MNDTRLPSISAKQSGFATGRVTLDDLRKIARAQRVVCLCFPLMAAMMSLALILTHLHPTGRLFDATLVMMSFFFLFGLLYLCLLQIRLGGGVYGVFLLLLTLPTILGFIGLLLHCNDRATKVLRLNGIRVGLLGAKLSEIGSTALPQQIEIAGRQA